GIARELKTGKLLVKIFPKGKRLEISAKHFRMQQSLQGAFFRSIKVGVRKRFRNDSGQKMVLVGKAERRGTGYLRRFGKTGPLNVSGNISQSNLLERRGQLFLVRTDLEVTLAARKRVELRDRKDVIDC